MENLVLMPLLLRRKTIGLLFLLFVFAVPSKNVRADEAADLGHVKVGIDKKLGKQIPLDLIFKDEEGNPISLRQAANGRPLVIDMAYYTCPGICDNVLAGLADVLDNVDAVPGKDFDVATISFDPEDDPKVATAKKEQYWGLLKRPFPANDWRFLTGDSATIHKLTDALGFYFTRDNSMKFIHPTALIIVDGNGKLIRYIQGTTFAPVDLKMAIMAAKTGTPEQIISAVLSICFGRDPASNQLVFNVLRVVGAATVAFLAGFVVFLRSTKRIGKSNRKSRDTEELS